MMCALTRFPEVVGEISLLRKYWETCNISNFHYAYKDARPLVVIPVIIMRSIFNWVFGLYITSIWREDNGDLSKTAVQLTTGSYQERFQYS